MSIRQCRGVGATFTRDGVRVWKGGGFDSHTKKRREVRFGVDEYLGRDGAEFARAELGAPHVFTDPPAIIVVRFSHDSLGRTIDWVRRDSIWSLCTG